MKESPAKDGDVPIDGSKPEKRQRDKRLWPDHEKRSHSALWLAEKVQPNGQRLLAEGPLPTLTDEISRFTNKYIYLVVPAVGRHSIVNTIR